MAKKLGKIAVIHGPMFSGKTEELLRRLRRAKIAKRNTKLFKPAKDQRYSQNKVLPHHLSKSNLNGDYGESAVSIQDADEILKGIGPETDIVGIEEGQFFGIKLFSVINRLSNLGIDVVMSLLDQDFRRMPFPIAGSERGVGDYLAISHESLKLTAICMKCGANAGHTQKLIFLKEYPEGKPIYVPASYHSPTVVVGTAQSLQQENESAKYPNEVYEARCSDCHELPDAPEEILDALLETEADAKDTD